MLEKSRVVRVRGGELPYHIFTYILHGADSVTKQELQLHANSAAECPYYKNSQVNISCLFFYQSNTTVSWTR